MKKFLKQLKNLINDSVCRPKNLVITGDCQQVEIKNGKIFVNGKKKIFHEPKVNLIIKGSVSGDVSGSFSKIVVEKGVLGNVRSTSGSITINGDVGDTVENKYGEINLKKTWRI
ncbi:MAG: hypothetical protein ACRCZ2_01420 [Fusobacteriaceae bacterium]